MSDLFQWLESAAEYWWPLVWRASWQAAVLGALVLGVNYFGRRLPSKFRYALLVVALAKFAVPPGWTSPTAVWGHLQTEWATGWAPDSAVADWADPADRPRGDVLEGLAVDTTEPSNRVLMPVEVEKGALVSAGSSAMEDPTQARGPFFREPGGASLAPGETVPPRLTPGPIAGDRVPGTAAPRRALVAAPSWKVVLLLLHLLGTAVLLLWLCGQYRNLRCLTRGAREMRRGPARRLFLRLNRRFGMHRTPRLLVSDRVHAPVSYGVLRPAVLLPAGMAQRLNERQLEAVLAHEIAHQRHGDLWVNAGQLALVALWWFHPVIWLVSAAVRRVREDCCDDELIRRRIASEGEYCETLLKVAAELRGRSSPRLAVAMAHREHALARRFRRIMDPRLRGKGRMPMSLKMLIPLFAIAFLPGAHGRPGPAAQDRTVADAFAPDPGAAADSSAVDTSARGFVADDDAAVERALDSTTLEVSFDDSTLEEVIEFLRLASGVNFVIEPDAAESLDRTVNLQVVAMPLRKILELVLALAETQPPLAYSVKNGVVVIGGQETGDSQKGRRLVVPLDRSSDVAGTLEAVRRAWQEAGSSSEVKITFDPNANAIEVNGPADSVRVIAGIVRASLPGLAGEQSAQLDRSLLDQARNIRIPELSFEDDELAMVAEILTAYTGIHVTVDAAVHSMLDPRGTLISLEMTDASVSSILDEVAEAAGAEVFWTVEDGQIRLALVDDLFRAPLVRRGPIQGIIGQFVLARDLRQEFASNQLHLPLGLQGRIDAADAAGAGNVLVQVSAEDVVELVFANTPKNAWTSERVSLDIAANNQITLVQIQRFQSEISELLARMNQVVQKRLQSTTGSTGEFLREDPQGEVLPIRIHGENTLEVNGHWMTRDEVEELLTKLERAGRSAPVVLTGSTQTDVKLVTATLELVAAHGFKNVTIGLSQEAQGGQRTSKREIRERAQNDVIGAGGGAGGGFGGKYERRAAVRGGGAASQKAVKLGLDWLRRHQDPRGFWDADEYSNHCVSNRCDGKGSPLMDVGNTGLALLAFLGSGSTLKTGPDRDVVKRAVQFLREQQGMEDGCIGGKSSQHFIYNHGIATLALVEAYHLSQAPFLKPHAQKAVDFICRARNPYKAWRYSFPPDGDNDTSVSSWMMMALFAAVDAGLTVDQAALRDGMSFLDEVTDPATWRTGYHQRGSPAAREPEDLDIWPPERTESMTAAAMLMRIFNGEKTSSPALRGGAELLRARPPKWNEADGSIDFYYWYYGTYAMWQIGGEHWRDWQGAILQALVKNQHTARDEKGSWDPQVEPWGDLGGRVYSTALNTLTLQVYYRYAQLEKN